MQAHNRITSNLYAILETAAVQFSVHPRSLRKSTSVCKLQNRGLRTRNRVLNVRKPRFVGLEVGQITISNGFVARFNVFNGNKVEVQT